MHHATTVLAGHAQTDPNGSLIVGIVFVALVVGLLWYILSR